MSNRYRSYSQNDDPPLEQGDLQFVGVNQFDSYDNLQPGEVQDATNVDFTNQTAVTRGGFVALPSTALSPLSLTWTSQTPAADRAYFAVTYGNGLFVAVAEDGTFTNLVQTSVDGITWITQTAAAAKSWHAITYGNGLFVAVDRSPSGGTQQVMTSPDGVTWTIRTTPISGAAWYSVVWANNLFVAVGDDNSSTGKIMTSPDGITWTLVTAPANTWRAVTYGNGLFVAVGSSGTGNRVATSPDGTTWTSRTSAEDNSWVGIVYGANRYVAVAISGTHRVMSSPDGITWTAQTAAAANNWQAVTFANGLFVAVSTTGTGNRVMVSRDGATWATNTSASDSAWFGIAFGAGVFVAVANNIITPVAVMTAGISTKCFASAIYSDPNDPGSQWIMEAGPTALTFVAYGRSSRSVSYASGLTVSEQSTIVQCNNLVYIFRGSSATPLYWTGNWGDQVQLAPTPSPSAGFEIIPNSDQATYCQNRLWIINGKDKVSASDVLDFTTYDAVNNEFNLSTGSSDFLVTTYPFGTTTLLVFKNKSIFALTGVDGTLADVVSTEITRQVGAIGINAVVSVGADVVYMSDRNINLITLTSTNNALQHKTLPLSSKIQNIIKRVNWNYAYKVSMAYWDNKLFVALPLDNSTTCNSIVVYNFVTENWFGEWDFAPEMDMQIQNFVVVNYLGATRLHLVSEDGRIFAFEGGQNDISGTTVAEIAFSLTTRAYEFDNNLHRPRRLYADLATNRPNYSITAYAEGASEYTTELSDQTYSRSESWIFNDSTYYLDNRNNDFNRAFRKDYSTGTIDNNGVQCGASGIQPEMVQNIRIPLLSRRAGRLSWMKIENTTGVMQVQGVGFEVIAGNRGNYTGIG